MNLVAVGYTILSWFLQFCYEPNTGLNLVQKSANSPPRYFENSQKIRHPPSGSFTRQPNKKVATFGGKITHLKTLQ